LEAVEVACKGRSRGAAARGRST